MESVPSSLKTTTAAGERPPPAGGGGGGLGRLGGQWRDTAIPSRAPRVTGEITVFEETDKIWRKTKA